MPSLAATHYHLFPAPQSALEKGGNRGCKNTPPGVADAIRWRGCSCCPACWQAAHQSIDALWLSPSKWRHTTFYFGLPAVLRQPFVYRSPELVSADAVAT